MTILRALGGLTLGLLVFAGLAHLLLVVNVAQRLDDPELYLAAFNEADVYYRVYDEVLVDASVQDQFLDLLGGAGLDTQVAVEVLRDVMPPDYLQEQTEGNIDRLTGYLSHDLESLDLFLDLREPLDRAEAAIFDKAEQVIAQLEIDAPRSATIECTADGLQSLAGDLADEIASLSTGQLPESVPSLETLGEDCRRQEFDNWFDQVASHPQLDSETARIIEDERDDLRESFVEGDTRAFLEKVAAPLISLEIGDFLQEIRRDLQINDRLDLLEKLAEDSDDHTREDIDEQAEFLRDTLNTASGTGRIVALLVVIAGSLLLMAVYVPYPKSMLRWPGLTLLLGGGACLVLGFVLNSVVPGRIGDAVVASSPDIPTALTGLAGDLTESFARQLTGGYIPWLATVMVIGAVLFVSSIYADRLLYMVRGALARADG